MDRRDRNLIKGGIAPLVPNILYPTILVKKLNGLSVFWEGWEVEGEKEREGGGREREGLSSPSFFAMVIKIFSAGEKVRKGEGE